MNVPEEGRGGGKEICFEPPVNHDGYIWVNCGSGEEGEGMSQFGLAVRCLADKQNDPGSIPLRLSFLFRKVVVCGHCLCN